MTPFWIAAGALLALALGLVLPALLRGAQQRADAPAERERANLDILREQLAALDAERAAGTLDEPAHAAARAEIERRALDEEGLSPAAAAADDGRAPKTALALGLLLPLVAIVLYAALGNREALAPRAEAPAAAASVSEADVVAMVEQLAQRMETMAGQPNELEGWVLLARSYGAMQRFDDADRAWQRAIALAPQEAQFYADRADTLAMKQDRSLAGEPLALVEQALKLDPNNLKALILAGSAAFDRQDWPAANDYWTRARVNVPAGSELAATIEASLAEARSRSG
ncbi:MAG TPA: c-type cytochrome biogenesis protein CcmI, partial [Methylibium sp.]|nr:c-type cytochrome biogenesis protein CcmI [Methylibium sp.]